MNVTLDLLVLLIININGLPLPPGHLALTKQIGNIFLSFVVQQRWLHGFLFQKTQLVLYFYLMNFDAEVNNFKILHDIWICETIRDVFLLLLLTVQIFPGCRETRNNFEKELEKVLMRLVLKLDPEIRDFTQQHILQYFIPLVLLLISVTFDFNFCLRHYYHLLLIKTKLFLLIYTHRLFFQTCITCSCVPKSPLSLGQRPYL